MRDERKSRHVLRHRSQSADARSAGSIHGRAALHREADSDRRPVRGRALTMEEIAVERRHYKIAILGGTGAQGTGLALRLAVAGHEITIGSRDAERARAAAADLSARTAKPVAGTNNSDAASAAEI